ncbi:hypothetical protein BKA64DRAFT_451408 [Cadophora sp. MPI-SDFR-AT-0126]|nr:hypothetical protein BKA64DRAFT_451408 [Leotiomycetes sp. MPI-SDFR-AT-0126]
MPGCLIWFDAFEEITLRLLPTIFIQYKFQLLLKIFAVPCCLASLVREEPIRSFANTNDATSSHFEIMPTSLTSRICKAHVVNDENLWVSTYGTKGMFSICASCPRSCLGRAPAWPCMWPEQKVFNSTWKWPSQPPPNISHSSAWRSTKLYSLVKVSRVDSLARFAGCIMKVHRMLCVRGSTESPVLARWVWFAGHAGKHGSFCMREESTGSHWKFKQLCRLQLHFLYTVGGRKSLAWTRQSLAGVPRIFFSILYPPQSLCLPFLPRFMGYIGSGNLLKNTFPFQDFMMHRSMLLPEAH